jgi:hypothetical protein
VAERERVKLWLDDVRLPPKGWTWAKTVDEAVALFGTTEVTDASLDHDLGTDAEGNELPEGRTLVYWMAENDRWPSNSIAVHSANPVGVDYMLGMIERYGPFVRDGYSTRFIRRGASDDLA